MVHLGIDFFIINQNLAIKMRIAVNDFIQFLKQDLSFSTRCFFGVGANINSTLSKYYNLMLLLSLLLYLETYGSRTFVNIER